MKKIKVLLKQLLPLLLIILPFLRVNAQISAFDITIRNDVQISDKVMVFDVYLLDLDASQQFELASVQAGIVVNSGIYNGGTITVDVVAGYSDLSNSAQWPTSLIWSQAQNTIKLTPKSNPGAGNGSIISTSAPGNRICRIRITNSVSFTPNSHANLTFNFTTAPYPTRISQYIGGSSTPVACNATNCFSNATNITLNPVSPPIAYNVTGSGSYCQGTGGLAVGLDNSEVGVTYTLFKYGIAQTPTVTGIGAPISFGSQPAGTYTVTGRNSGDTTDMTGSAIIIENPIPNAPSGNASQSFCSDASPTVNSLTATGTGIKWYSASSGGAALASTVALTTATEYWASQTESGCESSDRFGVTVTINSQLNANVVAANSSCYGSNNGSITFSTPSGGSGVWNYSIDNGSTWFGSTVFSGLAPGTYPVAIQDDNILTCVRSLGSKVITEPAASNGGTVSDGTTPVCLGTGTGTMTVRGYTGTIVKWQKRLGSDPWSDINTISDTYSETPSSAGIWEYQVVVQNGTGCPTANSVPDVINVSEAVTATAGTNQSVSGTWSATLDGNVPAFGTGVWTKESGPGNASFSPNTNNGEVTVDTYGTYTFRWTIVNGACSSFDEVDISFSAACASTSVFSGTGNWSDNTKWDNGIPTACINATINGDVTVTAGAVCNKLIVNPGKTVIINPAASLAVNDSLKLKASTSGNAAMIDKGTLTYPALKCEVLMYLAGSNARDTLYHMFSAPVVTPSINTFWYFYMFHYDEIVADWVINYTNDVMVNGFGYAGFYTGNISQNPNITLKYRGYGMNTGTHTYNLSNAGEDLSHYNLVGNPYPSAVNLDSMSFTGVDNAVYFWNSSGTWAGQYGSYNLNTHLGSMDGGNILPAYQALFVSATGSSPSVTFSNNARVKSNHPFYKSYNTMPNHLQLVVKANDYNDALIVGFVEGAQKEYDGKYDARKLFGGYEMIPSLYSKTEDGVKVSINELPQLQPDENAIVPVEFTMGLSGIYTIKAEDMNTFDSGMSVYLEDKSSNTMINLKENAVYTFNYNTGENADRFNLHFRMGANGITENEANINIYSYDRSIYINGDQSLNGNISVYNVLGQEIVSRQLDGKTIYSISMNGSSKGYYMVKVISGKQTITRKVYID